MVFFLVSFFEITDSSGSEPKYKGILFPEPEFVDDTDEVFCENDCEGEDAALATSENEINLPSRFAVPFVAFCFRSAFDCCGLGGILFLGQIVLWTTVS